MKMKLILTALIAVSASVNVLACASCGCSLNTDYGTQGMGSSEGWTFDLRYDYLNQNQLRSGKNTISNATAVRTTNTAIGGYAEVEGFTTNRYLTAGVDYNNGNSWGVQLSAPYIQRNHMTYGVDDGSGNGWPTGSSGYRSNASGIGDVKVIGRYFGWAADKDWGIQFGLKLPTGGRDQVGTAPDASSTAVDPGLQLGTGTTDLILGVYKFDHLGQSHDWGYFTSLQIQHALKSSTTPTNLSVTTNGSYAGTYQPGDSLNLNFGFNYHGWESWIPTVQINYANKRTDSGTVADTYATGGQLIYLTPGAIFKVSEQASVYTNVQLPLYQNLNGIQLAPEFIASVGVRFTF
jgi:hypothetical protein